LADTRRLLRLKQEEKLAAQKLAEAEAMATERKAARVAQAHRGELRDLQTSEYRVVKTLTGNISAYTPSADECSGNPWITASGKRVHYGTIAAPPAYPFGTLLRLPDYDPNTIFVVEDRGGAIKGNHFDLWLPDKPSAFAFGRRNLTVEIIELTDNQE
jgi:rare lipoprotein A